MSIRVALAGILVAVLPIAAGGTAHATPACNGRAATIIGTEGDDVLIGTPGPDVIWGGGGDDVILAAGADVISTVDSVEEFLFAWPRDHDTVCAGPGNDVVETEFGNDWIDAGAGDDVIEGGPGNDWIRPGFGEDVIDGDWGYHDDDGVFLVVEDLGKDILDYSAQIPADPDCQSTGVIATLRVGTAVAPASGWPCVETDHFWGIEGVRGTENRDRMLGDHENNIFWGLGGEDTIEGERGGDRIFGGDGDDLLAPGLFGIGVTPVLDSPNVPEEVDGGAGDDVINCVDNTEIKVYGGPGDDDIKGCSGTMSIYGESGNDTVDYVLAESAVTIDLTAGTVSGWGTATLSGIENAAGGSGDDRIEGNALGNDLYGNGGDDLLIGHGGYDYGDGGSGVDTCLTEATWECES